MVNVPRWLSVNWNDPGLNLDQPGIFLDDSDPTFLLAGHRTGLETFRGILGGFLFRNYHWIIHFVDVQAREMEENKSLVH